MDTSKLLLFGVGGYLLYMYFMDQDKSKSTPAGGTPAGGTPAGMPGQPPGSTGQPGGNAPSAGPGNFSNTGGPTPVQPPPSPLGSQYPANVAAFCAQNPQGSFSQWDATRMAQVSWNCADVRTGVAPVAGSVMGAPPPPSSPPPSGSGSGIVAQLLQASDNVNALNAHQWNYYWAQITGQTPPAPESFLPSGTSATSNMTAAAYAQYRGLNGVNGVNGGYFGLGEFVRVNSFLN